MTVEVNTASRMEIADALQMAAETYARGEGIGVNDAHFFALAFREALVNAIRHGHGDIGDPRIRIRFEKNGDKLLFTVRDQGPGFDPTTVPDPLEPENMRRGSGRGVFYMRKLTDKATFEFPEEGGTVVRLEKRLPTGVEVHETET
jgi:serine/threonine-protein kinase RsbW